MANTITDIKKIDFSKSALTFFYPNGKIICINKIKGYDLHIEYLKLLAKNDKEIKKLLSGIDFNYYVENPAKVLTEIMPIFAKNNYSVYINLNPNVTEPTNYACFVLAQDIPKSTKTNLLKMKNTLVPIIFIDIVKFIKESTSLESVLENDYNQGPNSNRLFEIIEEPHNKLKSKRK